MIAADASTCIAFLQDGTGGDAQLLDRALEDRQVVMPPVMLTEPLSKGKITKRTRISLIKSTI
jgi:hypothetical protein